MKTKTVRGEELEATLLRVIPNAKVTVVDGNLNRIEIEDVSVIVNNYCISVTVAEKPIVYSVTFKVGDEEFTKTFTKKEDADAFRALVDTTQLRAEVKTDEADGF